MKKNILFLLLFILVAVGGAKAQQKEHKYIPLLDTNKIWVEAMMLEFGDITISEKWIGNEIIYNDTVYYELFGSDLGTGFIYLREDTLEKKVYIDCFNYQGICEDILLYDFSLQVGDSINCVNWSCILYLDSILIKTISNKERKLFYFHSNWGSNIGFEPVWIEGIGSLSGVLNTEKTPTLNLWGFSELNCLTQNNEIQYMSYLALIYGCNFEYLGINQFEEKIKISPNPVYDLLFIDIPIKNIEYLNAQIFDVIGNIIINQTINNTLFQIDVSNLPKGIYIIKIYDNNNNFYTTNKFIKQ